MRERLSWLRTALAVAAALLLIVKIPAAYRIITTPDITPHKSAKSATVLRVWYNESWTGGGMQWLFQQIAAFEKSNLETRVTVRRVQKDEWKIDGIVLPDVLLFEAGAMESPEEWLMRLKKSYPVRDLFQFSGSHHGLSYAVPVCYGGNVRLINENKKDGIELVMQTEQQYQEFVAEKASALIASVREARKLSALREAGKGFPFQAEPYGNRTDMVLYAAIFGNTGERIINALAFLDFLLSEQAQNKLPEAGLLPALESAAFPDPEKYPLLNGLCRQIEDAANAFD